MSETKKRNFFSAILFLGAILFGIMIGASFFLFKEEAEELQLTQMKTPSISSENNPIISGLLISTQIEPKNAELWVQLGNAYYDENLSKEAARAYKEAISLNTPTIAVLTDYATMLRTNGEKQKALQFYDKALLLNPEYPIALYNKGLLLYFDLDRKEDAFTSWEKLLQQQPDARTPEGQSIRTLMSELHTNSVVLPLQ